MPLIELYLKTYSIGTNITKGVVRYDTSLNNFTRNHLRLEHEIFQLVDKYHRLICR